MSSTDTTTVILKVQDQFSQPLQKYATELGRAGTASQQFAQKTSGFGSSLRQGATDMFHMISAAQQYAQVIGGVVQQANQWANMGIAAERNKIALRSLTGAGAEYEAQINGIINATKGMVTAGEAAGYAYRLQRFGLAETGAEMEKFMRTVSIVSAINPQLGGTAEAINQIQLTLSNMSYMRLDQLGVSAGQVRKRIAELKAETKGLSDEEAFQIAVMEQLEMQANAVGDSILGMDDAGQRMQARWRGFKEDWGLKIAQGFDAIWGSAEGAAKAIDKVGVGAFLSEASNQILGTHLGVNTQPKGEVVTGKLMPWWLRPGGLRNEPDQMITFGMGGQTAWDYQNYYSRQQQTRMEPLDYSAYYARQAQTNLTRNLGTTRQQMTAQADVMGYTNATYAGSLLPQDPTKINQALQAMAGGVTTLTNSIQGFSAASETASDKWDSLNEKFGIAPKSFDTDVYSRMTSALSELDVEGQAAADAMMAYQLATGMATGSSELFDSKLTLLTTQLGLGTLSAEEYAKAVRDLGNTDFSGIDALVNQMFIAGSSMTQISSAAERIAALPTSLATRGYGTTSADYQAAIFGEPSTTVTEGPRTNAADLASDPFVTLTQHAGDAQLAIDNFTKTSADTLAGWQGEVGGYFSGVEAAMDTLDGKSIHIKTYLDVVAVLPDGTLATDTATSKSGGGGTTGAQTRTFASGGWTGDGPANEIAGFVHNQELVLSRDMLRTMRSGSQAGYDFGTVHTHVILNEREIGHAVSEVKRKRGDKS